LAAPAANGCALECPGSAVGLQSGLCFEITHPPPFFVNFVFFVCEKFFAKKILFFSAFLGRV
jgi:hypothetical protein